MFRQAQSKQRQNVQKFNSEIRKHNNAVRHNNSERKRAIDSYNREVRAHNNRLRANQARLKSAQRSLSQQTVTVRYTPLHASVSELSAAYERLDTSDADPVISDLAERDTANSVTVLNSLLENPVDSQVSTADLATAKTAELLAEFSPELGNRWAGAIYALNPNNPDAARHFCSSARELIGDILDSEAPDKDVLTSLPNCDVTDKGTPTRRTKVHYCLARKGMASSAVESYIETDIKDLNDLFKVLNTGTHGPAGKFSLVQLAAIKTRVEDTIEFVCEIVS